MRLTRRLVLQLAGASAVAGALPARGAADEQSLFWRVGDAKSVIFGYVRIAASQVPDIVAEGSQDAAGATRLIQDLPATTAMPPLQLDRAKAPAIASKLDEQTASALRDVITHSFPKFTAMFDQLSGIEVTLLLSAEGQAPANPTVGGTIAEAAVKQGRPVTALIAQDELRSLMTPPDLAAMNNAIGQATIAYLLDLRQKNGPIGGYLESLYKARKVGEIRRLTDGLKQYHVFSPSDLLRTDKVRALLTDRLEAALKDKAAGSAFVLMPVGIVTGEDGLVANLRQRGLSVTAID
jgi:hypothetical protein